MAFWIITKIDGRRSSPYRSTLTISVFVALCLLGFWMMTSKTVVPVEFTRSEATAESNDRVSDSSSSGDEPKSVSSSKISGKETAIIMEESSVRTGGSKDNLNDAKSNDNDGFKNQDNGEISSETSQEDTQGNSAEQNNEGISSKENEAAEIDGIANREEDMKSEPSPDGTKGDTVQNLEENEGGKSDTEDSNEFPNVSGEGQTDVNVDEQDDEGSKASFGGEGNDNQQQGHAPTKFFPDGAQSEILNETNFQNGAWSTQASESNKEKKAQGSSEKLVELSWKLCNTSVGPDYIPCLDNGLAIKKLRTTKHYEHRERHCPEAATTCLVPLPDGYLPSIKWPSSRDKVWYKNVPHTELVAVKGHQNWVKVSGEFLTFPGGGTQFTRGALHYIDNIQKALPAIEWGKQSRVVLDVGCGVASFGGYLFERDTLTMSFAPKDEHEAQVQFALERGIPAISAVMGTQRLPFPGMVFDVIHCARCRVPWHIDDGMLLLELNRLLRPGGYFVWSATPVYLKLDEDVEIWRAMTVLTKSMCWDMVSRTRDKLNKVGLAIYRKPLDNTCYDKRKENKPPLCPNSDDPNAAWYIPLQACMHMLPAVPAIRGWQWPAKWPERLERTPDWLNSSQLGVYGKPAPDDFQADYEHWKHVVSNSYENGMGIDWSSVRNVMDMRAIYGGFAAAMRGMNVWVMNIVNIDSPDTLPIIYERGLIGIYHDWCESFSTYPRSYDLLHADHLFSRLKSRCDLPAVMAEVDRVLRPGGKLIVRDQSEAASEILRIARSLHWEVLLTFSKEGEDFLCVEKTMWRPMEFVETVLS